MGECLTDLPQGFFVDFREILSVGEITELSVT